MRIVQDHSEGEAFIDVLLNEEDIELLKDLSLLAASLDLGDQRLNIGFKLDTDYEIDDW
jgi:hypothetical protein